MPLSNPLTDSAVDAYVIEKELEIQGYVADAVRIEFLTEMWDDDEAALTTVRAWYDNIMAIL